MEFPTISAKASKWNANGMHMTMIQGVGPKLETKRGDQGKESSKLSTGRGSRIVPGEFYLPLAAAAPLSPTRNFEGEES
jgi:hypothetical protein